MIRPENKLIEGWYRVQLEDNPCFSRDLFPIRIMGKYHFIGYLINHINGKLIFNLKDNKGSVILPFENIQSMVPYYDPFKEKTEDFPWE